MGDEYFLIDLEEIYECVGSCVDLVLDGGWGEMEISMVVDLEGEVSVILCLGKGDLVLF